MPDEEENMLVVKGMSDFDSFVFTQACNVMDDDRDEVIWNLLRLHAIEVLGHNAVNYMEKRFEDDRESIEKEFEDIEPSNDQKLVNSSGLDLD